MKKQWKLDNKGMTLLEVIVAFAIFAIAATILITGFNGALKVMGNSEKIKNASQENTGKLNAVGAEALKEFEGLQDSDITETDSPLKLKFDSVYSVPGTFYTATSKEKPDMDMKMFQPDGDISKLSRPSLDVPKKPEDEEEEKPPSAPDYLYTEWKPGTDYYQYIEGNENTPSRVKCEEYFYECIKTHKSNNGTKGYKPTEEEAQTVWVRINGPKEEWMEWVSLANGHVSYGYLARVSYNDTYWVCTSTTPTDSVYPPGISTIWARTNKPNGDPLDWVNNQSYYTGAIVRYNGKLYQNNGEPTLYVPGTPGVDWVEVKAQ